MMKRRHVLALPLLAAIPSVAEAAQREPQFQLPVGDWSSDGHKQCEWFTVLSDRGVDAWREGYFKARAMHPHIAPDTEPHQRGHALQRVSPWAWPTAEILRVTGFDVRQALHDAVPHTGRSTSKIVAMYTLAFCQLGDPSLRGELVRGSQDLPMLQFFGYDHLERHIGHVGYEIWMDTGERGQCDPPTPATVKSFSHSERRFWATQPSRRHVPGRALAPGL